MLFIPKKLFAVVLNTIDSEFQISMNRNSRLEVFCKKGVLRNFTKFTGKYLCQSLFFNKVAGLRPATLLKKRLWHRCFPVHFAKFLKTNFLTEHLRWLLLHELATEESTFTYFKRYLKRLPGSFTGRSQKFQYFQFSPGHKYLSRFAQFGTICTIY